MFYLLILLDTLLLNALADNCEPYGFRIALGQYFTRLASSQDVMRITFNTFSECKNTFQIRLRNENHSKYIHTISTVHLNMTDLSKDEPVSYQYETYIHTAKVAIQDLLLNKTHENYHYQIVSNDYTSEEIWFNIPNSKSEGPWKFILVGDMDSAWKLNRSKPTFDWFQEQARQEAQYDAVLYLGDMAYDFQNDSYQLGDQWLRNVSYLARNYPFMITPGNHDHGGNKLFQFLRANFATLDLREYDSPDFYNDFYSFDVGPIHIMQYNPMLIVYQNDEGKYKQNMLNIFKRDLELNMNAQWKIVFNHYPLYCSDDFDPKCLNNAKVLKDFEQLYIDYKVDLFLAGHQHSYERDKPYFVENLTKYEKVDSAIYQYGSPIQIIEGAGGMDQFMPSKIYTPRIFTEAQAVGVGLGILTVQQNTAEFKHIYTSNGSIADQFQIVKLRPQQNLNKFYVLFGAGFLLVLDLILIFKRKKQDSASQNSPDISV